MGNFGDFTPELREQFLDHIRNGMRRGAAGEALGIERFVVLGYIADHPEFEARVLDSEDEAVEHIEEAIYQSAASGNFQAAKLWLERTEAHRRARQVKAMDVLGSPEAAVQGPSTNDEAQDDFDEFLKGLDS